MPVSLNPMRLLRQPERRTVHYLPQYAHLDAPYTHMIRHMNGSVFAMFEVAGVPWDDLDRGGLKALHERLCSLHRMLAMRSRVTITQFICRAEAEEADVPRFLEVNELARRLNAGYRRRLLDGKLWINRLFLGAMIRPPLTRSPAEVPTDPVPAAREDVLELEHTLGTLETDLGADYGLRRLGLRVADNGVLMTEIGEALGLIITGRHRPVPLPRGRLGLAICPHRPVFRGRRGVISLRHPGRVDAAALLAFSVYPGGTDAAMFDHVLAAPYRCTVGQSFTGMPLHEGQRLVASSFNQFTSANDPATSQKDELIVAKNELQNRQYALGIHHLTMAVFADSEAMLDRAVQKADDDLRASGAIVSRQDFDVEAGYFGLLPGTEGLHCRSVPEKTRNFAAFAPMHNYPRGWRNGRWCDHVALFTTNGGTPYYWNPHVDSEGQPGESPHIFLSGPNRAGKTTLLLFLIANAISRARARVALWDKDRGTKLAVLRMGGEYFEFRIGEDSGLAPLRVLDPNNPGDMDFLGQLTRSMMRSINPGPLSEHDDQRITFGLRIVMSMPVDLRSFAAVASFIDPPVSERLRPWCRGEELGWVVDNPRDRITLTAGLNAFDQTHYLDHPLACGPIQSVLFHRVGKLADGSRPLVVAIDEFWKSLRNAAFRDLTFDGLKTFPKLDAAMWLATQSVADPMSIPEIAHTVREQILTQFHFPNGSASEADYGAGGLGLPPRALDWISAGLNGGGKGRFLLKQGSRYTPLQLSLEGEHMEEVRAELSGRAETVKLMDEIIAEMGLDDRDALFDEFHQRRKAPGFQRALRRTELAVTEDAL